MSSNRSKASPLTSSAVADRLLAHARLCEQIAQDCWSEQSAEELRRMARECSRAAAEMAPERQPRPYIAH